MFCSKCGVENQVAASFCHKCGTSLSNVDGQQNLPASVAESKTNNAIWNPNAAACWSFIFSPAFGSYIQMLNWEALGQRDKADTSKNWFYASLAILALFVLMGLFMQDADTIDGAAKGISFLYLLVWYFSVGRFQGKFVEVKFGPNYLRKPWGKTLLIAIGALIGYFILAIVVLFVFGLAS